MGPESRRVAGTLSARWVPGIHARTLPNGLCQWEMFNGFNTVNLTNYEGNQSLRPGQTVIDPFQGHLGIRVSF